MAYISIFVFSFVSFYLPHNFLGVQTFMSNITRFLTQNLSLKWTKENACQYSQVDSAQREKGKTHFS
jgi:hypothetical protein